MDNSGKNFGIQFPLPSLKQMGGTAPDHKPRTSMQESLADSQFNLAILKGSETGRHYRQPRLRKWVYTHDSEWNRDI